MRALLTIITAVAAFETWNGFLKAAEPVPTPKGATFVNSLGMKFAPVPGTKVLFSIWDTRVQDYAEFAKQNKVSDLWQKQSYPGNPVSREPDYPVVGVTRDDAAAFCRWLTAKEIAARRIPEKALYRLPTDLEWSAAVGLGKEEGATPRDRSGKDEEHSPWGTGYPPPKGSGNYADDSMRNAQLKGPKFMDGYDDGFITTSPVGSFKPNPFCLYDMGGNVSQWVSDPFDGDSGKGVLRGGCFAASGEGWLKSSSRASNPPAAVRPYYGFRCVLTMAEPTREVAAATPKPIEPPLQPMTPPPSPAAVAMGPAMPCAPGESKRMTPMIGGQSGKDFAETQPEGGILVGIEVWKGTYYRDLVIGGIRGIYKSERGEVRGAVFGQANGAPDATFESKGRFGIIQVEGVDDRKQVIALRVRFQNGEESPWIGRDVPKTLVARKMPANLERKTLSTGQPAHGLCGALDGTLYRLGLIF